MDAVEKWDPEVVDIEELRPHPRNYREHPEDQLEHLAESIREHGLYRNIAVAKDGTILAGHGVALACRKLGLERIPVLRLPLEPDDPRALKLLAGDNEISNLARVDDRALTELLKEVKDFDVDGLLGTGYDEKMLAGLVMVTRPESEITDFDAAAEWVGMPEYDTDERPQQLLISFKDEDERLQFVKEKQIHVTRKGGRVWSCNYGKENQDDLQSLRFEAE